jgi:hypothetical protein
VKALQCTEEDLVAAAGLDAVAFNRMLVFRYTKFPCIPSYHYCVGYKASTSD